MQIAIAEKQIATFDSYTAVVDNDTKNKLGSVLSWNGELVEFNLNYIGDDLHISVWKKDVGKYDLVAEAIIKLSGICLNGGIDEWYLLQHKGRDAGYHHLKTIWHPYGRQLEVIVPGLAKPVLITTALNTYKSNIRLVRQAKI